MTKKLFLKHRWVFNLVWWIVITIISFLFFFTFGSFLINYNLTGFWFFFLAIVPVPTLQIFGHWLVLKHLYPQERRGNLLWVILMPVFLFLTIWFILMIWLAIGLSQLHD